MIYLQCPSCGEGYSSGHVCPPKMYEGLPPASVGIIRECEELKAQLAECRAVLKEAEWASVRSNNACCPVCRNFYGFGPHEGSHAADCRLAKCLGGP